MMKKMIGVLGLLLALSMPGVAAAVDPVPGTNSTATIVNMKDGESVSLPSNEDLAKLAGLQDTGIFNVPQGDKSILLLTKLFGVQIWGQTDAETTVIGDMMGIWNLAVMVLGVIFIGWIIFAGILKTAHEGEVLGRQWSSVWIPVRTAAGFIMILPVVGGYCLAQIMVAWLASVGVGLADGVWNNVGEKLINNNVAIIKPGHAGAKDRVYELWHGLVCMEAVQNMRPDVKMDVTKYDGHSFDKNVTFGHGFVMGDTSGTYAKDMCGGFNWDSLMSLTTSMQIAGMKSPGSIVGANGFWTKVWGSITGDADAQGGFSEITNQSMSDALFASQQEALYSLAANGSALRQAAHEFVANGGKLTSGGDPLGDAIKYYSGVMDTGLNQAASNFHNQSVRKMVSTMQQDGWVYAGSFFMQIVHLNEQLRSFAQAEPESVNINFDDSWEGDDSGQFSALISASETYVKERDRQAGIGVKDQYVADYGGASAIAHAGLASLNTYVSEMVESDRHPIIGLQNMGNNMIDGLEAGGALYMWGGGLLKGSLKAGGAKAAQKAADLKAKGGLERSLGMGSASKTSRKGELNRIAGNAMDGTANNMDGLAGTIATIMLFVGVILAIVIPMLPYIVWSLDVLGWLVAIIVSVIAAPVWMAMHMHPEGHDFAGYGARGYTLLLSVAMKAPLMVISLMVSMMLSWVSITFISGGWMYSTASANSNQVFGLLSAGFSIVLFSAVMLIVTYKCFTLIHGIQNEVLEWIGGRDHDVAGVQGTPNSIVATAGGGAMRMAGVMSSALTSAAGGSPTTSQRLASMEKAAAQTAESSSAATSEIRSGLGGMAQARGDRNDY